MAIAGEIQYKVVVDTKSLKEGLNQADQTASNFSKSATKSSSKLGKAITTGLVASAVSAGVALAGVGKEAVELYADYQQLEGGVNKIFGDEAAKMVIDNAKNAFKTAGVSANEYMNGVMNFSASLMQSVGGDAKEAAKIADMAFRDMADNMNTFGTDMESIQHAYQGFAKQNYTMLDNLKLGYGGTKSEMERLLADAEKLTGIHYDINELDDVYNAIHAIQVETAIAGTTQEEAANTISGSLTMLKASWENLLLSIGSGEGMDVAFENFSMALETFFTNLTPVLERIKENLPRLVELVAGVLPKLVELLKPFIILFTQALVEILDDVLVILLPPLLEAIGKLIVESNAATILSLINMFLGLFEKIGQIVNDAGAKFSQWLHEQISNLVQSFREAVSFVGGIIGNLWNTVKSKFGSIGQAVGDAISGAVKGAINNVIGFAEGMVNRFVNGINGVIGVINAIPGVSIGYLSTISIPRLASGGIVGSGGSVIMAGEGGEDEWVVPESKMADMIDKMNAERGTLGGVTINIQGVFATSEADQRRVAEQIYSKLEEINKSRMGAYLS